MIVDTSAVLAILFNESDAETYARAISEADSRRMSAASFVEAAVVVEAQTTERGSRQFDACARQSHRGTLVVQGKRLPKNGCEGSGMMRGVGEFWAIGNGFPPNPAKHSFDNHVTLIL
jgi:hypothetical protein